MTTRFTFTALALALFMSAGSLAGSTSAQAQDMLLLPPKNPTPPSAVRSAPGQNGYDGLTSWKNQQPQPDRYAKPPADNMYDFIQGGGNTSNTPEGREARRLKAQRDRQHQTMMRQKENLDRARQEREKVQKMLDAEQQKQLDMQARAKRNAALPYNGK